MTTYSSAHGGRQRICCEIGIGMKHRLDWRGVVAWMDARQLESRWLDGVFVD